MVREEGEVPPDRMTVPGWSSRRREAHDRSGNKTPKTPGFSSHRRDRLFHPSASRHQAEQEPVPAAQVPDVSTAVRCRDPAENDNALPASSIPDDEALRTADR